LQSPTKVVDVNMEDEAYRRKGVAAVITIVGDIEGRVIFDIESADRQRLALQTCLTRAPRPKVLLCGSPIPRRKAVRSIARPMLCIG